uniref:(northern house mosquito) hypothetical protein n=1 Tax=Culex pipiens TaxID=7175 RepID=A0A8D8BFE8_CULPI
MAHLELLLLTVVAPLLFAELLLAPGADGGGTRISCYRRLRADDRQPQLTIRWFLTTMSRLASVLPASSPRKFRTSAKHAIRQRPKILVATFVSSTWVNEVVMVEAQDK